MKALKITIAALALLAAILITLWTRAEAPPASADASSSTWKCRLCGAVFELAAQDAQAALANAGGQPPILCTQCAKLEAYRPVPCITCREWIFGGEVPGSTGRCPRCQPDRARIDAALPEAGATPEDQPEAGPAVKRPVVQSF